MLKRHPNKAMLIYIVVVWSVWAVSALKFDKLMLFVDYWFMSITMVFGSFVAGLTSEGGGAVAFPIMTLVFNISPAVARDFSLMIQSVGMISAAIYILIKKVPIEKTALLYAFLGGILGIGLGFHWIAGLLPPAVIKVFFTSFWLSFVIVLYMVNKDQQRFLYDSLTLPTFGTKLIFVGVGMAGGIVSSLLGTGIDILTFSLLVLTFHLCEKVATATSVILMGALSLFAFFYKGVVLQAIEPDAWNYWWVCVPVVAVGAPLGAMVLKYTARIYIRWFLYSIICLQYVIGLFIIPQTWMLVLFSLATIILGLLWFTLLRYFGGYVSRRMTS
jgi:uncharacterized membrane protein YfcA